MDSTVVGVFQTREDADRARQKLLAAGFAEPDVGIHVQSSAQVPQRAWQKIRSLFGAAHLRHSAIVTVYGSSERVSRARDILGRYQPSDVQMHVEQPRPATE